MATITTFAGAAAAVVFWELIKQIGVRFVQGVTPPAIAQGLLALDRLLPQLLADGVSGAELEARLRAELGELTGSEWRQLQRRFDLSVFFAHQTDDN